MIQSTQPQTDRVRKILTPLLGLGPLSRLQPKVFHQTLAMLVKATTEAYIEYGDITAKDRAITVGRIFQIGWFKKQSNDEIFKAIEDNVRVSAVSVKSKPIALAIRQAMNHR